MFNTFLKLNLILVPIFYFKHKGRVHKNNLEKVWSFAKPPLDPPQFGIFSKKKFTPIFFVENCIFNGRNEFYAWSHFKNK